MSAGVIEFANPKLVVEEDAQEIIIYLRCWGGCKSYEPDFNGIFPLIKVNYKYSIADLNIIERKALTECTFTSGSEE